MADQMPGDGKVFQGVIFSFKFLDAVFAEVANARIVCRADRGHGLRLCYPNDSDLFGLPSETDDGACDALADAPEIHFNSINKKAHHNNFNMTPLATAPDAHGPPWL